MHALDPPPIGTHLRQWRRRRSRSQLDLALEANVSQRHLSFVESGRAKASRDLVLRLAECLDVPLRDRNLLLLAAGYAPRYAERPLDDPALRPAKAAVEQVLAAHEPFPALAVDRHWTLVAANGALAPLLAGIDDRKLLEPPVNVLRLALHPQGLASRIVNFGEWRHHLLTRLRQQIRSTVDPHLQRLWHELSAYPSPEIGASSADERPGILVPLVLDTPHGRLSLISTTTVFGTAAEITLAELVLETFLPADAATASLLRQLQRERA